MVFASRYAPHTDSLIFVHENLPPLFGIPSPFRRVLQTESALKSNNAVQDDVDTTAPTVRKDSVHRWLRKEKKREPRKDKARPIFLGEGWIAWNSARSYEEWCKAAQASDVFQGYQRWKLDECSDDGTDYELLRKRLRELRDLYLAGDIRGLCFCLRSGLMRGFAGVLRPTLHSPCAFGTKRIVEDYVEVVAFLLEHVAKHRDQLTAQEALTFFNEARHAYGRTALVLSGGAMMGLHHLGVVKALLEQDLLPMVVSGTSAGSIVAALVGTIDKDRLRRTFAPDQVVDPATGKPLSFEFFREERAFAILRRLLKSGVLHDVEHLSGYLRSTLGDVTFEEAYQRSGRILNVTITPKKGMETPMLLNYLTEPRVLVWSAVTASCALPGVFSPVELYSKDMHGKVVALHPRGVYFADGSIRCDIPLSRLGELFNVNHFIVSQVNPHFVWIRRNWLLQTRLGSLLKAEIRLRYWQLLQLGLIPSFVRVLFPVFVQPYEGDVTISPEVDISNLLQLFANPAPLYAVKCTEEAKRRTFAKLEEIRMHCLVENTLEWCARRVAKRGRKCVRSCSGFPDAKAPSWLWRDSSYRSNVTTPTVSPSPSMEWTEPAGDDTIDSNPDDESRIC